MTHNVPVTVYQPIEPGTYDAQVETIEDVTGKFGDQLKIRFKVQDDDLEEERTLLGWCSAKYSAKTKLGAWSKAILGQLPVDGDATEFDVDQLIGLPCRIQVGMRLGSDGIEHNTITDVLPVSRKTVRIRPVPVKAPVQEEPEMGEPDYSNVPPEDDDGTEPIPF